jgi:hypothetical protein
MDNQILQSLLELLKSTGGRRKEEEPCRICETRDLVKNGGFEGVTHEHREAFKNWMQETHGSIVGVSNIPYEGELAARLISRDSKNPDSKKARLFQNIAVTPGCRYELSFAENFFIYSMKSYSKARLSARVFYVTPTMTQSRLTWSIWSYISHVLQRHQTRATASTAKHSIPLYRRMCTL